MRAYKVFSLGPKGGLRSAITYGKAGVRYRKDRPNKAPEWLAKKGNHLTIFTNLRFAKKWRTGEQQIWVVTALDVFKPTEMQKLLLGELSKGKFCRASGYCGYWPRGTKMSKKIYLLSRIAS